MTSIQKVITSYKAGGSLDKQKHALDKYDKSEANGGFSNERSSYKSFDKVLEEKLKKAKN
jgi:hypothetical protein